MKLKQYIALLCTLLSTLGAAAQDSMEVSILTCEPGEAIYERYGHTAVRVRTHEADLVFNYGVFDFNAPHFLWRWLRGETDYQVAAIPYEWFQREYASQGRRVWQQVLRLDSAQMATMASLLARNCRPENRHYRYNFLYDNCTTRCRDMIERVMDVEWPEGKRRTYRQIIHEFAGSPNSSLASLGQDLLLGWSVDTLIGAREQMFSPIYFMHYLDEAGVARDRELIMDNVEFRINAENHSQFSILNSTLCLLLLLLAILAVLQARLARLCRSLFMLVVVAVSCIVTLFYFFSQHPSVDTNPLICVFNPFTLVVALLPWLGRYMYRWRWMVVTYYAALAVQVALLCTYLPWGADNYVFAVPPALVWVLFVGYLAIALKKPLTAGPTAPSPASPRGGADSSAGVTSLPLGGVGRGAAGAFFLPFLFSLPASAQDAPRTAPRLVVMISVDQLRTDYLEAFSPLFTDSGLRKLMREGRVYTAAQYPFAHPDGVSAPACLFTGASPYENGVVGATYLNRATLRPTSAVADQSPALLEVSTLSDELKLASGGKAVVFSVAPEAGAAIFTAGHAANGALWLDPQTAEWTTSTYYGQPVWLTSFNRASEAGVGQKWEPVTPLVGSVNYYVGGGVNKPFEHKLKTTSEFLTSGLVNDKVTHCALQCLHSAAMGRDGVTDLLAVTYYAGGFNHQTIEACGMELQDTYVRLDAAIATLLREAEAMAGEDKVLVVLTSTGYCDQDVPMLEQYHIPTGTFSINRARSILNMYLGAVYGAGNYVEAVYGNGLFLDHKLIEQKQINGTELLERAQDLLLQMEGVKDVYTTSRLALGAWTPGVRALRNSHHPQYRGDITLQVQAGWHIVDNELHTDKYSCESYVPFPLIFMGAGITAGRIDTPVEVDCVAPTVAGMLRIRSPNACKAAPLGLK